MNPTSALGMMARGARQLGELASGARIAVRGGARVLNAAPFDLDDYFRAKSDEALACDSAEAALRSHERAPFMGAVLGTALAFGFFAWNDHKSSRHKSKLDRWR
jgi:hypothetical protein